MVLFESGTVRMKYGADFQLLDLESVEMRSIISANEIPPIDDVATAIHKVLDEPVDNSEPLSSRVSAGQKVVLIVSDHTQRWFRPHIYLPPILDYLNEQGIPDSNISILIANGSGRPRPDLHRCIIGDEAQSRVGVFDHDSTRDDHIFYGTTSQGVPVFVHKLLGECDHVIITSGISYDLLAGFSGGRASICPGVASSETIKTNHNLATLSSSGFEIGPGLLSANPIHQDMMEICAMVRPTFCFNVICNEVGKHIAYFAGDWDTAWEAGCHAVQRIYAIPVTRPTEVVIASVGGYPKDESFYSAVKGLYQASGAIEPGGTIIFLAECGDGHGNSLFFESMQLGTTRQLELSLASEFSVPKQVAYLHSQVVEHFNVILVSSLSETECLRLGMTPASSLADAISRLHRQQRKRPEVALLPQADLTLPIPF